MHATRRRALFQAPGRRAWTLDPPAWWRPERSVDELIAERLWKEELQRQWEIEPLPDVRELRGW